MLFLHSACLFRITNSLRFLGSLVASFADLGTNVVADVLEEVFGMRSAVLTCRSWGSYYAGVRLGWCVDAVVDLCGWPSCLLLLVLLALLGLGDLGDILVVLSGSSILLAWLLDSGLLSLDAIDVRLLARENTRTTLRLSDGVRWKRGVDSWNDFLLLRFGWALRFCLGDGAAH